MWGGGEKEREREIILLFINELLQVRKYSSKPKSLGCFWIFKFNPKYYFSGVINLGPTNTIHFFCMDFAWGVYCGYFKFDQFYIIV